MNIYVKDVPTLIGDFLGCLPTLQHLCQEHDVYIDYAEECNSLYELIPRENNIVAVRSEQRVDYMATYRIDISRAFDNSHRDNNWYMSQAFFKEVDLPVPHIAPKASLEYGQTPKEKLVNIHIETPNNFYLISPFARSLPTEQLWSKEKWEDLIKLNPEKKFLVLGNTNYNPTNYIAGENVHDYYDYPLIKVASLMQGSRGLISVVTGTSHLAFHLGVKNIVLNNQNMTWGRNPDGIHIETNIQNLKPEEVNEYLQNIDNTRQT